MKRAETRSEERTRSVVMLGFPHANIIDVSGPLEVFANANRVLDVNQDRRSPRYRTQLVAHEVGPILTTSGLELMAQRALRDVRGPIDTLVVPGGDGSRAAIEDRALITWIRRSALRARRVTSVCTGALLLAEAGLLDGRRAVSMRAPSTQCAGVSPTSRRNTREKLRGLIATRFASRATPRSSPTCDWAHA